jgi:RNA polymerase sigma factor (sigma-70 family)
LNGLTDEELVARVQQTDDQLALAVLVERYHAWVWDRLRPRAQRAGFQEKDLEDAVQDGLWWMLVRVIPRFAIPPPDSGQAKTFRTFFEHCLFNRFVDVCRARRRAHQHLHLFADLGWDEDDDPPPGTLAGIGGVPDPAASAEAQEQVECLQTALERLPLDQHEMLVWVVEGIPLSRIAQCHGVSLATLNRALYALRGKLRAEVERSSH